MHLTIPTLIALIVIVLCLAISAYLLHRRARNNARIALQHQAAERRAAAARDHFRDALAFYAERGNWSGTGAKRHSYAFKDRGQQARVALEVATAPIHR